MQNDKRPENMERITNEALANEFIDEIINIQPDGNKAKPYQVKQVRNIILKYGLEV